MRKKDALKFWVPPPERDKGRQIRGSIDTTSGLFISSLIQSKKWCWKNEGDFVRSAVNCLIEQVGMDKHGEYKEYFSMMWEMCAEAQLIHRLKDVASTVAHLVKAVEAHLGLGEVDEAATWLKKKMDTLTVKDDNFSQMVLKKLEETMTNGGPGLRAVWMRVK